ncbi:MAG: 3-dehydro-scyllo-inosose hydrolase [Candidatus Bipolaricaulota bacterium]
MAKWELPPKGGHMDRASNVYFQNMTGRAVRERLKVDDILLIPVGSTEAHGDGAPYGEDTFLVTRMAEKVAERTGCTVAQPIWYGSHPWAHLGMPGTVIVPEDTFTALLRAVIAGFWNAGFRKQILLNGHGQEYVIPNALHQFMKTYQVPAVLAFVNWPTVIPGRLKDKAHGGPFDTPFKHADEAETSYSLALFPEFIHLQDAVDTKPAGFLKGNKGLRHIDAGGDVYQRPIPGHAQVGLGGLEVCVTPEGVVGAPTLAKAEKAIGGVEEILDYLVELHDDILEAFPPGVLPPIEKVTQRKREDVEAVLRGPRDGGPHLYTMAYPP